jgi:serine/threonine-protein kinase
LILSLLAKRPEDRPNSGAAVAQALREEIERIAPAESAAASAAEAAAESPVPAGPDLAALAQIEHEAGADARAASARQEAAASSRTRAAPKAAPPPAPPASAADLVTSPLVRKMLRTVLAEPVMLSAEERYLMGHYLAYLMFGSRQGSFLRRRKIDRRNADRARYLLGMSYALASGPTQEAVEEAAVLLEEQFDVRPALSPVVVAKYLSWRDTPQRTRLFRQTRKALLEASAYARQHLTDAKGVLNPGLMPQTLDDLRKVAPRRGVVDDVLVERWNRLAEVWRDHPDFRTAALRYASKQTYRDPASQVLWPEVVYPLIELARWKRRSRSRAETLWESLFGRFFHLGDAGLELDRLLARSVPAQVVASIDDSVKLLAQKPDVDDEEEERAAPLDDTDRLGDAVRGEALDLDELAQDRTARQRSLVALIDPDPIRFLQGQLHELWKEAVNALTAQARGGPGGGARQAGHRHIPLGSYRLIVVASIRGKAAGQVAVQGMVNKQIEMTTPSFRTTGSANRPILAVWLYRDNSLVLVHLDFQSTERYILWHAPLAHELKFDDPAELLRELDDLGLEPPDQLADALSRRFRPRNRV